MYKSLLTTHQKINLKQEYKQQGFTDVALVPYTQHYLDYIKSIYGTMHNTIPPQRQGQFSLW